MPPEPTMTTTPSAQDVATAELLSPCDSLAPPYRCPKDDECPACIRVSAIAEALATARAEGIEHAANVVRDMLVGPAWAGEPALVDALRDIDALRKRYSDVNPKSPKVYRDSMRLLATIGALRADLARAAEKLANTDRTALTIIESVERERNALCAEMDELSAKLDWNQRERTRLERERDTALASAQTAERHLGNLLARIHRDGGHHQDAVGTEQAVRDADAAVVRMLSAEASAQGMRVALAQAREVLTFYRFSDGGFTNNDDVNDMIAKIDALATPPSAAGASEPECPNPGHAPGGVWFGIRCHACPPQHT